MKKISLSKTFLVIFLCVLERIGFAHSRVGPELGLIDYLNETDQILVGTAERFAVIEVEGLVVNFAHILPIDMSTKLALVLFEKPYLISQNRSELIDRTLYVFVPYAEKVYFDKIGIYFFSHQSDYPSILNSFFIDESETLAFYNLMDPMRRIKSIDSSGLLELMHPLEKDPGLSYKEFEHSIQKYLTEISKDLVTDYSMFLYPGASLKKIRNIKKLQ